MAFRWTLVSLFLVAVACGFQEDVTSPDVEPDPLREMVDDGCPDIFRQDILPEYQVKLSKAEWSAVEDEFEHRPERENVGQDPNPYHRIDFEYDGEHVTGAMLRLKGQSSWFEAIALDEDPKMQFVISFNEVDPAGRFHGVRKLDLDMPRTDASFLRQRLGLYYLRRAGVPAQCANSARLVINGDYYGLYTNLEHLDKEFLQRVYGDFDEGDLWKGGRYITTNEETHSTDRIDAFWAAETVDEIDVLVDLDASIAVWATEAMEPQADGYYNGRANFYLYDHPISGFRWISHDLDSTFDFLPADTSPLFPVCEGRHPNDRQHWSIVLADQEQQEAYVDSLEYAWSFYDTEVLSARVIDWSGQIAEAAAADHKKPFTTVDHEIAVQHLSEYPAQRSQTVRSWIDCRRGGSALDSDNDGFKSCFDCDDQNAAAHPGATETCNGLDDNCDGQVDQLQGGDSC